MIQEDSCTFEPFKVIQEELVLEMLLIDPVLQDNVLLPMNFTKYVCHVGHGNELRSMVHNGLIPGGFITKTGRYAVFFTVVDPMDDEQGLRETFCDSSEARISRLIKRLLNHLQNTVCWCNLPPGQQRGRTL